MGKIQDILNQVREYQRGITTDRLIGTKPDDSEADLKQLFLDVKLTSDRDIYKLLNKLVDEVIENHDDFNAGDRSATIISRFAMKIKDSVNASIDAKVEEL